MLQLSARKSEPAELSQRTVDSVSANRSPPIWAPLVLLVAGSLAIRVWDLDLIIQRWFWLTPGGWRFEKTAGVDCLYRFGNLPGLIVGGSGLVVWAASFLAPRLRSARLLGGFLALALSIGPGLLVNEVFKEHFGRPRPLQVAEFGGEQQFRPLGETAFNGRGKSFPSGHASMGFFWFAPGIYFWTRRRGMAWGFICLALLHGGVMGFGRLAQGAHWASDILWSAGIVYLSSWILNCLLNFSPGAIAFAIPFHSSRKSG
jgi:membrane-associated PAP2 superfamily phosphatase